ncbi:MAG TPA: hypothetical protein VF005_01820 [Acidimicrobiales bacterium]
MPSRTTPSGQRRARALRPPPLAPGPGAGLVARADTAWTAARTPARSALKVLDGLAVVAWTLLAVMLLVVTVGPAIGAFDVSQVTPGAPPVHPVPAQAPHWQPPPKAAP